MKAPNLFRRRTAAFFRPIGSSEAPSSAEIHRDAFAHPWSVHEFESILGAQETIADGVLDGFEMLQGMAITRVIEGEGEILTIALRRGYRSKGNGSLLLEYHLTRLACFGVRRLFLEVSKENAPARHLYSKFNFVQVGERRGYFRTPNGGRSDALVLARDL
jgi:ribosomal-protein-alanine N-acetyltransferase